MRACPRCQDTFDDVTRFCPRDGSPLEVSPEDPRIGQVVLGDYRIEAVCGRGAMGTVYRARQHGIERKVAVKVLRADLVGDPSVVRRFHREAQVVAAVSHPNIVKIFQVGTLEDGLPCLVMELVDGEPLSAILDREPVIAPARTLKIVRQVLSALAEAHAAGVIHRDLKPANLMISQRRRDPDVVHVLDFGIAKLLDDADSKLSRTGTILGTPHYIAPEQAAGADVDRRADLYSLGVMVFRMVTGQLPFEGPGVAVLVAHMQRTPPAPRTIRPDIDPSIEAFVLKALEKDPAARYQSAEEMGDALELAFAAVPQPTARAISQPVTAQEIEGGRTVGNLGPSAPLSAVQGVPSGAHLRPNLTQPLGGPSAPGAGVMTQRGVAAAAASGPQVPRSDVSAPVKLPVPVSAPSNGPVPIPAPPMPSMPTPVAVSSPQSPTTPMEGMPPVVNARYTVDAEAIASADSFAARLRTRTRLTWLVVVVLLGGAGAGGWLVWKRMQDESGAVIATALPDAAAVTTPPPRDAAAVVAVVTPDAARPDAAPPPRIVTLGEDGWAARVALPPGLTAGKPSTIVVEVFDPTGAPLEAQSITVTFEPRKGSELIVTLAAEAAGRFVAQVTPLVGGWHHVHVYPEGIVTDAVHMYLDVDIAGPGSHDEWTPHAHAGERAKTSVAPGVTVPVVQPAKEVAERVKKRKRKPKPGTGTTSATSATAVTAVTSVQPKPQPQPDASGTSFGTTIVSRPDAMPVAKPKPKPDPVDTTDDVDDLQ